MVDLLRHNLLDPGGLLPVDLPRFIAWGIKVFTASVAPLPVRRWAAQRLRTRMILDPDLMAWSRVVYRRVDFAIPDGAAALDDDAALVAARVRRARQPR